MREDRDADAKRHENKRDGRNAEDDKGEGFTVVAEVERRDPFERPEERREDMVDEPPPELLPDRRRRRRDVRCGDGPDEARVGEDRSNLLGGVAAGRRGYARAAAAAAARAASRRSRPSSRMRRSR